jgi:hypothetical protein
MENKETVFAVILAELGYGVMENHLHATLEGAQAKAKAIMTRNGLEAWEWDEGAPGLSVLGGSGKVLLGWKSGCDYIEIFKKEIGA